MGQMAMMRAATKIARAARAMATAAGNKEGKGSKDDGNDHKGGRPQRGQYANISLLTRDCS